MSEPHISEPHMSGALLEVAGLSVRFGAVTVLEGVSFSLHRGETLGLVGESGAGKSTLARALLRLIPVSSGSIEFLGGTLSTLGGAALRRRRKDLQIVFQDPLASLNPRMTIGDALAEPLRIHEPALEARARDARVAQMLERVGLPGDAARRYPHEFSGGQCQRIGIARAMMPGPQLLICDEPVSSLDVSIQGQIVNLLADLQREMRTAMLFISHNLAVVRHLSHRVLVMYRGRLVEEGGCERVFTAPVHPYTRELLAAVRSVSQVPGGRVSMRGEDPAGAPPDGRGCSFHPRCPFGAPSCLASVPAMTEVGAGHRAACHRWREVVYS